MAHSRFDKNGMARLIIELVMVIAMVTALLVFGFFLFGWPTTVTNFSLFLISLLLVCVKMAFDNWKRKSKRLGE